MGEFEQPSRAILTVDSRPCLSRGVRLRHDAARDRWIILAPEKVLTPDPVAVAILQRMDGQKTVSQIAEELAEVYDAGVETILSDVIELLQGLADKGYVSGT